MLVRLIILRLLLARRNRLQVLHSSKTIVRVVVWPVTDFPKIDVRYEKGSKSRSAHGEISVNRNFKNAIYTGVNHEKR